MMFHRFMWTNFLYYTLDIHFYLSLFFNLTSHFSNFADFRQLQTPNTEKKCYEILPARITTPHNPTRKITNRYFELKYHFLTPQKSPITVEQGYIALDNDADMKDASQLRSRWPQGSAVSQVISYYVKTHGSVSIYGWTRSQAMILDFICVYVIPFLIGSDHAPPR